VAIGRPRYVGPAIRTSGGGALARRATTASGAVTVLAVVATVITAIVVFVVVLVPVATGADVSAIGRARLAYPVLRKREQSLYTCARMFKSHVQ
jgi:hypothetical protein